MGGNYSCDHDGDGTDGIFWFVDPAHADPDGPYGVDEYEARHDFVSVLVHELGHALNLDHPDDDLSCDNVLGEGEDSDSQTNKRSVMAGGSNQLRWWRRRLHRDDIQAMRTLYGAGARTIKISTATGTVPTSWSSAVSTGITTLTPATLSSAQRIDDQGLAMGLTSTTDVVTFYTGDYTVSEPGGALWSPLFGGSAYFDPVEGPARTWHNVAVARGKNMTGTDRLIVAWVGGDLAPATNLTENILEDAWVPKTLASSTSDANASVRIFWRVRDGNTWRPPGHTGLTRFKNVGVGYAPREEQLVLAYIDTCAPNAGGTACLTASDAPHNQYLFLRTVSVGFDNPGWCLQAMMNSGHVLAVGNPVCDERGTNPTVCSVPVTTASLSGPQLRFVEGSIEPLSPGGHPCFKRQVMPETTFSTTYVLGLLSAALDARSSTGRVLYGGSPGFEETGSTPGVSGYGWLRNLTRTGTGYVSSASTQNDPTTFTTSGWPVMLGSQTKLSESGAKWRAINY